jgi:hypothetical protein
MQNDQVWRDGLGGQGAAITVHRRVGMRARREVSRVLGVPGSPGSTQRGPISLDNSACRAKGTEAYSTPIEYLSEDSPRSSGAGALAGVCATG